jgi:hypothetical protein
MVLKIMISLMCSSSKVGLSIHADQFFTPEEAEDNLNLSRFICKKLREVATSNLIARENLYKVVKILRIFNNVE